MSNSIRGPQRGNNVPFVMHLERVCRLVDMGARFAVIEFNPNSDLGKVRNKLLKEVGLRIREGGDVSMVMLDDSVVTGFGLRLGNYKRIWRIWQNGEPTEEQRRAVKWG